MKPYVVKAQFKNFSLQSITQFTKKVDRGKLTKRVLVLGAFVFR